MRRFHTLNHAPVLSGRRVPSFRAYLRMGGIVGMVRGIIHKWEYPFTINQVKIAFHNRYPHLTPGDFQIDDILSILVKRGVLERSLDNTFQKAAKKTVPPVVETPLINRQLSFADL